MGSRAPATHPLPDLRAAGDLAAPPSGRSMGELVPPRAGARGTRQRRLLRAGKLPNIAQLMLIYQIEDLFIFTDKAGSDIRGLYGIKEDEKQKCLERLEAIVGHLDKLLAVIFPAELENSQQGILRLMETAREAMARADPMSATSELNELFREFVRRIHDELKSLVIVMVDKADRPMFYDLRENEHPFGPSVARAFPETVGEIGEAGRCLGLGRYSACAFHLMRALEAVLKKLARKSFGVRERLWDKIIKEMRTELVRRLARYSPMTTAKTRRTTLNGQRSSSDSTQYERRDAIPILT